MSLYTGRGDEGKTDLRDMSRVSKTSPRIEAYGTVDELNAVIGTARPTGHEAVDEHLRAIQNHLHVVQAEFANPDPDGEDPAIRAAHVAELESWIDAIDEDLDPLTAFLLPTGSDNGAPLHHARAVCRRAERRAIALADSVDGVSEHPLVYLNRLSDALFVFARAVNERDGVPEESPTY